jgi:mannose-6-phosphate isomerase-like protein (cupin superfamily)
MKGFVQDIEDLAVKNDEFRRVLYTAKHCQLVVMALKPKEEIGAEVHKLDQFFRVEEGTGEAILDGVRMTIRAGFAIVVPAGANHNIINTGNIPLKLYTLYAPPNHRDGASTILATTRRPTTNISTARRRSRAPTAGRPLPAGDRRDWASAGGPVDVQTTRRPLTNWTSTRTSAMTSRT